jgi:hypothetical protein
MGFFKKLVSGAALFGALGSEAKMAEAASKDETHEIAKGPEDYLKKGVALALEIANAEENVDENIGTRVFTAENGVEIKVSFARKENEAEAKIVVLNKGEKIAEKTLPLAANEAADSESNIRVSYKAKETEMAKDDAQKIAMLHDDIKKM